MIYQVFNDGAIFPSNIDIVIHCIIARSHCLYDVQELKSKARTEGNMTETMYRVDCDGVAVAPIDGRDAVIIDAGLRDLSRLDMDALYECETAASFCEAVNRCLDPYGGNRYFSDYRAAENYRAARAEYVTQEG